MQQRTVISNGKRYIVNVATDDGVGAGFALGQLVMKSVTDLKWYVVTTSGSSPASTYVSQSAVFGTGSYYEQNYPYQIVASNDGNAYSIFLTGTTPNVTLTVSQSAWGKAYITSSDNAVIALAKPYLLLQNITNGNYYYAGLTTTGGVTSLSVNQTPLSQSWVRPIY